MIIDQLYQFYFSFLLYFTYYIYNIALHYLVLLLWYQPEHCIGWARAVFDQTFNVDAVLLKALLCEPNLEDTGASSVSMLDSLQEEDISKVYDHLIYLLGSPYNDDLDHKEYESQQWAVNLFNKLFKSDIETLLTEHPPDQLDEEGLPFWGGARRIPTPIAFDPSFPEHIKFVDFTVELRSRIYFSVARTRTSTSSGSDDKSIEELEISSHHKKVLGEDSGSISKEDIINKLGEYSLEERRAISDKIGPEDFEKDDMSLVCPTNPLHRSLST